MNDTNKDELYRPYTLQEYVGQTELVQNLKIFINSTKTRDESLDHVLLYGAPGLGKTTLAIVIANELEQNIKITSGTALEKPSDLIGILSSLTPGDVLFIDEIHRIPKIVEESLYTAMEDFKFTVLLTRDNDSKSVTIDLPPFTLIGATTKPGNLSSPLRDRFGIVGKINFYSVDELKDIVLRLSRVYKMPINEDAAIEIAKRSRQTPRLANRLFRRVRDFAIYQKIDRITLQDTKKSLNAMAIDENGFDQTDILYLTTLIKRFDGGPVGLDTLAFAMGEDAKNLEEIYEPFLIAQGYVNRTPKGRMATKKSILYLKSRR